MMLDTWESRRTIFGSAPRCDADAETVLEGRAALIVEIKLPEEVND